MARSLSTQRRIAQAYVDVYDNDNLLSPILSESEPEEEDTTVRSPIKRNNQTPKTLNECSHKLKLQSDIQFNFTPGELDVELSDFERDERLCSKESSESDESDKVEIVSGEHTDKTNKAQYKREDAIDYESDIDIVLSDPDWSDDSLSDKPEPVSPDFTVEIVRSPNRKSLRDVIDTVDEAFSLDIVESVAESVARGLENPTYQSKFESKPSGHPHRSKLPTPKKHDSAGHTHQITDNPEVTKTGHKDTKPVANTKTGRDLSSKHTTLSNLTSRHPHQEANMSDPMGPDDVFDPFAPPNGAENIFEPPPIPLPVDEIEHDLSGSRFEVVDDSFKTRDQPLPEPAGPETKKSEDYCDSLEGDDVEDIREIEPPVDAMYEDELKAEATALAISIAKLSADPEEDEKKEEERAGSPDSLEAELEALDDAASLRKRPPSPGPPRCSQVKQIDIEALRKKQMQFPKFKARPSPFAKKRKGSTKEKTEKSDNEENGESAEKGEDSEKEKKEKKEKEKKTEKHEKKEKVKEKKEDAFTLRKRSPSPVRPPRCALVKKQDSQEKTEKEPPQKVPKPQAPKPKGRPPLAPSPRPPFKKATSVSKTSSDKQQNGMAKSGSPTSSETTDDVFKDGEDPLAEVLQGKVGDGLMANLLELGDNNNGKNPTRRSSASGESIGSAGADSSAPRVASLAPPSKKVYETASTVKRRQAIIAKKNAPVVSTTP